MELSEGEKIIQEAIRRKKEDEKRERKCNQELKKWDEVYKEIVSRYENVKESQETLTFQEYCLKQWMRKNGVELKICKITDAKVQNYLDEQAKNNAKNNKAEDPEYNLDVREKREKIGKEIKKKLKIIIGNEYKKLVATVYKGNIIKNLIMNCQSYTKYRPNETTGGIFVSWRRKEELPTGA